jgi:type I restriction enzyme, S subunit
MIFGEIIEIKKGKKPAKIVDEMFNGFRRLIQIDDLRPNAVPKYCPPANDEVQAKESDIIIAWDGANAATSNFGLSGVIGSTLAILRPTDSNFSTPYLGHFIRANSAYLRQHCNGATVPHLDRKTLNNLKIPKLSLPEQKRIAEVLDCADALRQKRRLALQKLDTLLQSVFLEMFGDGSHFPSVTLSKVCEFITKGTTPKSAEILEKPFENSIPFLKVYHITKDGNIEFNYKPSFISNDCHKSFLKRSIVFPDDVLMNIVGPPLGKIGIVPDYYSEWNINQAIAIFRALPNKITPRYLLHTIRSNRIMQGILNLAVGIRQQNLSLEQCRNISIPLPPIELQIKFSQMIKKIEEIKIKKQKAVTNSENLFQSLQQKAFKGELFDNELENELTDEKKVWQQTSLF